MPLLSDEPHPTKILLIYSIYTAECVRPAGISYQGGNKGVVASIFRPRASTPREQITHRLPSVFGTPILHSVRPVNTDNGHVREKTVGQY